MLSTTQMQALHAGATALPVFRDLAPEDLRPLADTGLAHDHVRLGRTGWLARVPKQSQMRLNAADNLAYQAACFAAMAPSGHTPRIHGTLPPDPDLPMGALIVEAIDGRPPRLPDDLDAVMRALAAIHRLPVPPPPARAPLQSEPAPLAAMLAEIDDQARHLAEARIAPAAHTQIAAELADARCLVDAAGNPPVTLISFDAHPGNFLIARTGRAVLVDLEKARYSLPGFDLAHATIYTSTTWDVATHTVLDVPTVARAYRTWLTAMPAGAAEAHRPWLLPARRLMWLWAVTWCAKWRVLSGAAACRPLDPDASAEDWSEDKSEAALIAHVRDRVDHYLEPSVIARVRRDWAAGSALHRLATVTRQK